MWKMLIKIQIACNYFGNLLQWGHIVYKEE